MNKYINRKKISVQKLCVATSYEGLEVGMYVDGESVGELVGLGVGELVGGSAS